MFGLIAFLESFCLLVRSISAGSRFILVHCHCEGWPDNTGEARRRLLQHILHALCMCLYVCVVRTRACLCICTSVCARSRRYFPITLRMWGMAIKNIRHASVLISFSFLVLVPLKSHDCTFLFPVLLYRCYSISLMAPVAVFVTVSVNFLSFIVMKF